MTPEANNILNHLASMPVHGSDSCTRAQVREIMLETGGDLLAQGTLWRIKANSLGAGVYRLTLQKARL